jgi:hypothetical protein
MEGDTVVGLGVGAVGLEVGEEVGLVEGVEICGGVVVGLAVGTVGLV